MLNLSFAGTLGRDAETRTAGSSDVTEFSVAVSGYDRRAKAKTTTWLKVNIWGQRGAQLAGMVEKGSRVAGSGQLEIQSFTNRDGEEKLSYVVTVQDLTLQSFKADRDEPAPKAAKGKPVVTASVDDDELPFELPF